MKRRSAFVVPAFAAVLATAIVASVGPFQWSVTRAASSQEPAVAPEFATTFDTPEDFFDQFDYGFTGVNPLAVGSELSNFHGDHSTACEGPTTDRTVALSGDADNLDFDELFWFCAPRGPESGHMMTGVNTFGYNIAWFSPRLTFADVTKVCWDINATNMSSRKWTQVLFVSRDDATRYRAGAPTGNNTIGRGTGGFDLGYTAPDFHASEGPNSGILPEGGTLAGLKDAQGIFAWFQNQDTFTADGMGWPGRIGTSGLPVITDKAARYQRCVSNLPNNQIQVTEAQPPEYGGGVKTYTGTGQIPPGPVRVVFEDDNYDPPKADNYEPNAVTWHWDNIQVYAAASEVVEPVPPVPPTASTGSAVAEGPLAASTGPSDIDLDSGLEAAADFALPGAVLLLALLALAVAVLVREGRFTRRPGGGPADPSQADSA